MDWKYLGQAFAWFADFILVLYIRLPILFLFLLTLEFNYLTYHSQCQCIAERERTISQNVAPCQRCPFVLTLIQLNTRTLTACDVIDIPCKVLRVFAVGKKKELFFGRPLNCFKQVLELQGLGVWNLAEAREVWS